MRFQIAFGSGIEHNSFLHNRSITPMRTATGTLVISNGQLIDGTGAPPVPDATLVITGGTIAYAGPAAGAPDTGPGAETLDARGGTILPGLVEAHFHATWGGR